MASEAEASCESYPNFAIICAFMEKFGELCGIGSVDFVELQKMLENNQEVSPELMNLHIKLLRKTKKNVTVERWERALVNICHNYSSKDAWEIERFGYKKTRLEVKLRALKELLEMQFDYNTKFKNEVNKMSSDSLRAQPLGRDKLGRAYWFQTDNNYQIRIYKEDPDEETWHLVAKDRDGLLSLISELADADLKLSSDSALNEDSNSLSEKPFIDTGQSDNSNESKLKDKTAKAENKIMRNPELIVSVQKLETQKKVPVAECKLDSEKIAKLEDLADSKVSKLKNDTSEVAEKKKDPAGPIEEESSEDDDEEEEENQEEPEKKGRESAEVKRPMLRIKSLSELMEKPKETRKSNFLPGLPELTIIKKAKLDSSQITITRRPRVPPKGVQVSPAVESPLMIIKGSGSGSSNQSCNIMVSEEIDEPVMYVSGVGSGHDCQAGKPRMVQENVEVSDEIEEPIMYFFGEGLGHCCSAVNNSPRENENGVIVSEEIEEEVFYVFGEGSGEDCRTGNEKEQSTTHQLDESKSTEACTLQVSKLNTSEAPTKVPIDSVNLDTIIDSKTDNNTNPIVESSDDNENQKDEIASPKKMQFFFGPGSLNIKPGPTISGATDSLITEEVSKNNGSVLEETKGENGEDKNASENNRQTKGVPEDEVSPSECADSEGRENQDNPENETSKNESDNEQVEEEDLSVGKQDQEKHEETIDSGEKEMEDEELKTGKIEEILKDDTPAQKKDEVDVDDDLTSKQEDSKDECPEGESSSVDNAENIQEKIDNTEEGNVQQTDQKEENRTEEIKENIHKDVENLKTSKEDNNEDIDESGVISEKDEEELIDECDKPTEISKTTEKPESANNITDDKKKDNIDEIDKQQKDSTTQKVEDKSEDSKVEDENDSTLEVADTIEKSKVEDEEKSDTTPSEADKIEESKVERKNDAITKEAVKIEKIEEKKDSPPKVSDEIKNAEVKKKKDKPLKVEEEIEEGKIEGKEDTIPKEDTRARSRAEKMKNKKGKVEITKKKVPVKDDDDEDKEIEENESEPKNQEKKRKRVTRNTSALTESITEEDMHPRKKVPVEKNKKKGPQKATKVNDKNEEDEEEAKTAAVEVTETRSTRQTRQTRASATVTKVQPAPLKIKGKLKKTISQTSKSDDAESPAPLESVIVETDNSNTALENPETDPLAVSEEETGTVKPVSSITSFSFDYNPNNPSAEESKRGLRKRGRDNLDDKPEPSEKGVKRPKMKGKRIVDQTLRKSVEERRQQVVDVSSDENELPKKGVKAKVVKKVPVKKKADSSSVSESDNASTKAGRKDKKGAAKNARLLKNLGVTQEEISSITDSSAPVRQSRRLAQIKIKEEATRGDDDEVSKKKKKKKSDDKDFKVGKRKRIEEEVKPAPTPPMVDKKKKKKTKPKKVSIGWRSSSEDSDNSCQEEEEVSEYEEHHEEEPLQFKSDHEFSPESDLEGDEPLPLKRARTVRKEESDDGEPEEEFPCQKCGKSDHPEWILLCDKCDNGWHCSCLRPPLFVIPEGDWFCPSCQHETLVENLNLRLVEYDKMMLKKEMEDRRKERLAYVGISLNNVLPAKDKKDKKSYQSTDSERSSRENSPSGSESDESDSDEPIYQLRQRRQAHSYKFQDYDDLINSALEEEPPPEVEKTHTMGRGKDIATIVNAAKEEEEKNGFEDLPPVVPRDPEETRKKAMSYRKKPKRLNNLEVNSEDEADDSDEDFKGSSSDESEEEDYSENSDDSFVGRKSSRPVRRSTRARTTRFDADFINDDSDNGSSRKKKKKKKRYFSDSDSPVSDDWGGKKNSKKSHKKSKKKKVFDDSDLENYRKKKPKIKYGMDSEDDTKGRRTRGKKTSYLDTLGSDSEEETLKKKIKNKSDDEYVAEDDEEKESEEEEEPEVEKPSGEEDEDEDEVNGKKHNSEGSDSEEETLVVKKMKLKNKRAIIDSDEEEEVETEKKEEIEKQDKPPKPTDKQSAIDKELEKAAEEFRKVDKELLEAPKVMPKPPVEPPKDLQQQAVLPGLNVDKLKACGITVTKVAKDKVGIPPPLEDKQSPIKLIEIGAKPVIPVLNQRNNPLPFPPVTLKKLEKNLDELDEDEVEEMMENEEYANRQLELAAIQIRQAKRMKELEEKAAAQPPPAILRKSVDIIPKKPMSGRFFNMKPPQETMLGNSSLVMNDDDNDELSEPPGATLPLFSELGSMKVHNLSKSNNTTRSPSNNTPPPPLSPSRAVPVPLHNMTRGAPHPLAGNIPMATPNTFGPSRPPGMMHQMRQTRPMGLRGSNIPPMMAPRGPMPPMDPNHPIMVPPMGINVPGNIPNPPRIMNMPPMSSSASIMGNNIPMGPSAQLPITSNPQTGSNLRTGLMSSMATPSGLNMTMGPNAHVGVGPGNGASGQNSAGVLGVPGPNLPSSMNESPDGTPKKRKGRGNKICIGKGKKTLAAEAAAAAAAAGLPPSDSNKTVNTKPPVANIEIASPPQPFSQSQPAPSVITRMLQTTPGKGAFPVGRIRPKQFAMMQDSDDNDSPRSVESQEKDMSTIPPPVTHSPVTGPHGGHPPGHYGPPPGQYPPNYYPKDGQPQPPHGFHHQRPAPPSMHQYPPSHPPQPPMDTPPMNPPPINQPPISMTEPPSMGQYSAPPPPSKSPYESIPPHRPPYPNSNPVYNYDYNAPPPVMGGEEGVPPPYENSSSYPDQYEAGSSNMDPGAKNVDEENSGEFGGLVSYFSSQHEDELEQ